MKYVPDNSKKGGYVDLRAEMNVLVVLHACPHPMNPDKEYPKKPVGLTVSI